MHSTERVVGNVTQKTQIEIIPPTHSVAESCLLHVDYPLQNLPPNFLRISEGGIL
jgi:hypothetical protein